MVTGDAGSLREVHDGGSGEAMGVEKTRRGEGDGMVTGNGEGLADGLAEKVALSADGMERDGNARVKSIEDGTRRDLKHMGLNGSQC